MSEQVARIVELRRLRPVKWSAVDKKTGTYRDGFVKTFLEFEGRHLLDEDGQPLVDGRGSQRSVTASSFAQRYGIARSTFNLWVQERRGYSPHPNSRDRTVPTIGTVEDAELLNGLPIVEGPPKPEGGPEPKLVYYDGWLNDLTGWLNAVRKNLLKVHAKDLTDEQWAALDTIQEQIARLYDEAGPS